VQRAKANSPVAAIPYLTLLIPCEYTKADNFAVSDGAAEGNVPDTADALAAKDGSGVLVNAAGREKLEAKARKRKWLDEIDYKHKLEEKMAAAAAAPNPLPEHERSKFAKIQAAIDAERKQLAAENDEAVRDGEGFEGNWASALKRRFILWPSAKEYNRNQNAPEIPVGGASAMHWRNWEFMPMVFGNQTTIEVEVPVSCNGKDQTKFVYHSWLDCLPKELAAAPGEKWYPKDSPPLRVTRTTIEEPAKSGKERAEPLVQIFRFHTISATTLRRVSVYPYDSLQY